MKKGAAIATGSRDMAAKMKARPIRAGEASRWQSQIASSMNIVATTWANCHDEPACAEYQTTVPNANTSDSTTLGARSTPIRRAMSENRTTLNAPSAIDGQAWFTSGPKTSTIGMSTSAGAGG